MKLRLLTALAGAALVAALFPTPASAQENVTVTAQVTGLTGLRTLVVPEAVSGVSIVGISNTSLGGSFTAEVAEVAYPGDSNGYTVNATLTNLTKDSDSISYGQVTLTPPSTMPNLLAGTDTPGAAGNFGDADPVGSTSAARTIFSNSGQSATSFYTATHTALSNLTLALPNGVVAGNYTGTLTVTLVD